DSWLTTRSPMRSWPSVMSSSPAIMLRTVDLPEPEGPTRIMNSPSSMPRLTSLTAVVPSGNRLLTCSRVIAATVLLLSFDRAGGETGDDSALEDEDEQDDRDGDDDAGRGDGADRGLELGGPGEEGDRGRHGPGVERGGERDREHEVVPAEDEHQDRRGHHAGGGQGRDHLEERLHGGGPVDLGGPLQLPGDLPEERLQGVDGQRQREGQVGDDQARPGGEQAQ